MATQPEKLRSMMGDLPKAHKLRKEISPMPLTVGALRNNLSVSDEFNYERVDPLHSKGVDVPGRFEAEIASCIVLGKVPPGIDGTYYRVASDSMFAGRNKLDKTNPRDNWINGDGAIDAWRFSNGVVDFKQKFVRTPRFVMERAARKPLFGNYRNPWSGDERVFDEIQTAANVHLHYWNGVLIAPKDDSPPMYLDPDNLDTFGFYDFDGQLNSKTFTAHPKIDATTGELLGFGMEATGIGSNDLVYYRFGKDGKKLDECWVKTPFVSWSHDMAVTDNYVIFLLMPWETDMEYMKTTGGPHFRYNRHLPNTFGVLPRRNPKPEDIRWFSSLKNHTCAHFSNHFEGKDGNIYIDTFLADGNALSVFPDMHPELGAANPNPMVGKFVRFKIDPTAESTELELPVVLSETMGEMARCDDRYATKPYKHAYGIVWGTTDFTGVAHINVETGLTEVWHAGEGTSCAEPCFSPRSPSAEEGDGYLIVCVRDGNTKITYVAILDALDIKSGPICLIEMPFLLKISAHGTWIPGDALPSRKPLVDYTGVTPEILERFSTGAPKYDRFDVKKVGLTCKLGPFDTNGMTEASGTSGATKPSGTNGTTKPFGTNGATPGGMTV